MTDIDYQVNTANNRLLAPTDTGATNDKLRYDAAGNLIWDEYSNPSNPAREFGYDAENKIGIVKNNSGGELSRYIYDADGQRARRIIGSAETWQVYGLGGELLAEYGFNGATGSPQKEYGNRSGQLLVVFDSTESGDDQLKWMVTDHLGSTRMLVNRSGSLSGIKRRDYLPFGEELAATLGHRNAAGGGYLVDDKPRMKFGSKERDTETGLDYFGARYFGSVQGRFTSTDPLMASGRSTLPQSWNRYSYVLNNPLRLVDPNGMMDDEVNKKERTVIILFWGGNFVSDSSPGSTKSDGIIKLQAGGDTKGLGESSLTSVEMVNIGQQIKNDFPDAEVTAAGPSAMTTVFNDLATNKPDHIIVVGFSAGAVSAIGLTNNLTRNGQTVDQLTTIDPAGAIGVAPIRNPEKVGDPVNFMGPPYSSTVDGANNVRVNHSDREKRSTPLEHEHIDDIVAPKVVQRVEGKLKNINQ